MLKKYYTLTIFLLIILFAHSIVSENVFSQGHDWKPMSPILDNSFDPRLRFQYCNGYEESINKEVLIRFGLSEKSAKKFRSQKVTHIQEKWQGSDKSVEIYRWYLATPEDAALLASTEPVPTGIKWDETPEIGDKTCFGGGHVVYFTKGSVLVRVLLNSFTQDKEYIKKIGKSIEKKL